MNKFLLKHGYIIAFVTCFVSGILVGSFYESRKTLNVIDQCKDKIDKSNKELTHLSDGFGYYIDYEHPIQKPITRTYMA